MSEARAPMSSWEDVAEFAATASGLGACVLVPSWTAASDPASEPVSLLESPATTSMRGLSLSILPGGWVAVFVPGRICDFVGASIRLAGFEIRDSVAVVVSGSIHYWLLARKPLSEKNVISNVVAHGTGGINVGAARLPVGEGEDGRYPPNFLVDADGAREVDRQAPSAGGAAPASGATFSGESKSNSMGGKFNGMGDRKPPFYADSGGASKFFPTVADAGVEWVTSLLSSPDAPTALLVWD